MDKQKFFLVYLLPFILVGSVLFTALVAIRPARVGSATTNQRLVLNILDLIHEHYVEPVSSRELSRQAIKGMVDHLDPYSAFLDIEATRAAEEDNRGEFDGLGIHVSTQRSIVNQVLTVMRPFREGPARDAGILPGDRIVAVDGKRLPPVKTSRDLEEVIRRLKGKVESKVTLNVVREEDGQTVERAFELTRAQVKVDSVLAARFLDPEAGIGYLRIDAFKESTVEQLDAVLARFQQKELRGLVIDLRRNGGGLLRRAAQVVDRFLDHGVIVTTRGRHPEDNEALHAEQNNPVPATATALVVLINHTSASASEAVAGALQDYRRALIVGERSYGKGVVQSVYRMGKTGTSLKITTSRYFTPAGRCINRIFTQDRRKHIGGIVPDVVVVMTPEEEKKVMGDFGEWGQWLADEVDPRNPPPLPLPHASADRPLLAALELLRGRYCEGRTVPGKDALKKAGTEE